MQGQGSYQGMGMNGGMGGMCGKSMAMGGGGMCGPAQGQVMTTGGMCGPAQGQPMTMGGLGQGVAMMGGLCGPSQAMGKGGQIMGMPGFGPQQGGGQTMGGMGCAGAPMFGNQAMGCMGGQGPQGFGSQAMGSMSNMSNMGTMPLGGYHGHMPFHSMMPQAKPSKQAQSGGRPASGSGAPGHVAGKRRFATTCHTYGQIPMAMKVEVLQRILPETWNPVTAFSKTALDIDSCLAIGFDRWPVSSVETRMVTSLAWT